MARQLVTNVALRNPATGQVESLAEGSDLPGWAEGMVGDHALSDVQPKTTEKQQVRKPRTSRRDAN